MPDAADLAAIEAEMGALQARLDELLRRYNATVDAVNEQTLAALDVDGVRIRTAWALRRLPELLAAFEEVLGVYGEVADWCAATFDDDDPWRRLRALCGADDLDEALEVILARLGRVVERDVKEGDAVRAREELAAIVARVG